ncbi:kinase [Thalictrum thalictroides]|uniref:Kinase n=1 Tax=Thalictrum thalictroides TaxID=46969 RepID=A0A7J6VDC7_THATH|nr:kinase [Thalictrum thalictroides]
MGNPRLTDFGLSAFTSPTIMRRPNGYRAPETLLEGNQFSHQKADIYAFGILLLEILTGIWPCKYESYGVVDFPGLVRSVVREEWMAKVFDSELEMCKDSEDEMVELVLIAMSCTSFSPNERPSIFSVMCMIEDIRKVKEDGNIKKCIPEDIKIKGPNQWDFKDYGPRI